MREFLILPILLLVTTITSSSDCNIATRVLEDHIPVNVYAKTISRLDLYASNAMDYSPLNMFVDKFVSLNLTDPESFVLYQGSNCTEVVDNYNNDNRFFGFFTSSAFSWRRHQFYPFNSTVIGISTKLPYRVTISTTQISVIRLGTFIGGILLFILASNLVRNTLVYYTSGCTFGILASLLLVAFVVWRVTPKKTIGIPILLGGWSVSLYMLHFAWSNFSSLIVQYQNWVAAYFGIALLISFALCYKNGPPTDARSHDIAQWFLQLFAIVLVYASCQVSEISISISMILVLHEVTKSWKWGIAGICKTLLSPLVFWRRTDVPRLLSEEEYEAQSRKATRVELDRLRSYCRSPETNAWKLAGQVKDPKRFARFIDGVESHISDDEEQEHMQSGEILDRSEADDLNDFDAWDGEITIRSTPRDGHGRTILIPLSTRNLENLLKRNRSGYGSSLRVQAGDRQTRSSLPLPKKSVSDTGPRKTPLTSRLGGGRSPSRNAEEKYSSQKASYRKMLTNRDEYFSSDSEADDKGSRIPNYSDS